MNEEADLPRSAAEAFQQARSTATLVAVDPTLVAEIVFEVTQESDGGYVAECLTDDIVTQADTWDELRANVKESVQAHYHDRPLPSAVKLHLVRDEILSVG
jgi:predicted RNase H-like HicB family nuclease